jgi:hypothetical protein
VSGRARVLAGLRGLRDVPGSPAAWELAALVIILLTATFFRANLFEAAPPGLQHDEVFEANFARDVLDGKWPVFFDANGGEEALFPYLAALSILLFGPNFLALRLVSLACGILSIAISYRLTKELFGRRAALFATAMLAVSFWHVFDSRVALRPITLLMMALASFYSLWVGLRRGGIWPFVVTGVFLGASFYTYTSGFLVPVTVVLFVVFYLLPFRRVLLLQRWRGILLALGLAVIIFLPMAHHVWAYPLASTARARDLSDHLNLLLAGQPGPLLTDVLNVLGMFGFRGDPEWRYNLAGRPVFDPLTFILFCVGFIICLTRIRAPEYAFLMVWLVVNMVPSAVTRHSPSTLRAIGSLTAIYILPSLALDAVWDRLRRRWRSWSTRALVVAVALLLAANAGLTYRDYFSAWAANAEVRDVYRADLSAVARFLKGSVENEVVCVSASFAADLDQQVLSFMMGERRAIRWFDGRQTLVFPSTKSREEVLYVFPATGPLHEELAKRFLSAWSPAYVELDPRGEPAFTAYRVGAQELSNVRSLQASHALSVDLEGRVELLGYDMPMAVEAGESIPTLLYWRVSQPIRPDLRYSFFAHLSDQRGYIWDQVDTLGYPVSSWIEGDLVVQLFDLTVPPDAPPLQYLVKMGLYDEVTGDRLTATEDGAILPDGVVATEPISVAKAAVPPSIDELEIPRLRQANFDGKLELLGCDLTPVAAERGQAVHIVLYWQALTKPQEKYVYSIIFTDEAGQVLDEVFQEPVDGLYPTSLWSEGQVVRDRFDIILDDSLPEGRHRLSVGVWDPESGSYLRLVGLEEDHVRLGKVYVGPGPSGQSSGQD